jgi:hypothetical protein
MRAAQGLKRGVHTMCREASIALAELPEKHNGWADPGVFMRLLRGY